MSNNHTNLTDDFGQDSGENLIANGHGIMPEEAGVSDIENEIASGAGAVSGAGASALALLPNHGQRSGAASSSGLAPGPSSTRPTESADCVVVPSLS
jgi:hypothetical protein